MDEESLFAAALEKATDAARRAFHFQVPGDGQGWYTIRVAPSPLTPQPTEGEYALVVSAGERSHHGS